MTIRVIAPHLSCLVDMKLTDEDPDEMQEAINQGFSEIYMFTPKGIIKHHKLRGENRFIQVKVDGIPGMKPAEINEVIQFLPAGKVPYELLDQVEAFFRKVMEVKKSNLEAMIFILWNAEQGYHLFVPDQQVSGASVRYDWDGIPEGSSIVVDIHSHNTMGAFFSGTDNSDDVHGIRFSGVFGKLNEATPMTVWRFNYRDKKYEVKLDDIFEHPVKVGFEVPEAWMDNVKTFGYMGTYGYYGNYSHTPLAGHTNSHHTPTNTTNEVTVNGKPHYSRRAGSGAHLGYVGNKFGPFHDDDDDIVDGPLDSKKANAPKGTNVTSQDDLSLPSTFWGLTNQQGVAANIDDDDLDDPVLQSLIAQGFQIEGVDPVGGPDDGSVISNEVMLQTMELLEGVRDNGRFDELAVNYGERIAASFCAVNEMVADLDQTPLLRETASDMVQMMTADDRVNFIKDVFAALPERYKVGIQTNGL